MPSVRSLAVCKLLGWFNGPRFRRAGADAERYRRIMDLSLLTVRVPPGVRIRRDTLAGVPVEWVAPGGVEAGSPGNGVVFYLHGGGCIMGSPAHYRELAGRLALGVSAPVLLTDYRLAPEHPYPAALEDALSVRQLSTFIRRRLRANAT